MTGVRLYELARGIDESPVVPDRPTKSISVEDTFEHDVPLAETEPMIRRLAEKLWSASRKESRVARTVTLKLKTSEFKILTRSYTPSSPPASCEELIEIALRLRNEWISTPSDAIALWALAWLTFGRRKRPPDSQCCSNDSASVGGSCAGHLLLHHLLHPFLHFFNCRFRLVRTDHPRVAIRI